MDFYIDCIIVGFFLATGAWLFVEVLEICGEAIRWIEMKLRRNNL